MSEVVDDKSRYYIPFIIERLKLHQQTNAEQEDPPLFVIGMNGVQGAGKTTLVTTLADTLRSPPYCLPTAVLSIDDLYLLHESQQQLAKTHPLNPLVQHRGEPSTHDITLGISVLMSLRAGKPTKIPQYDKSKFGGQGDRVDEKEWETVNKNDDKKICAVVFEGWCVGFRALGKDGVRRKWEEAKAKASNNNYEGRLAYNRLEDLVFVDKALMQYDALTDQFDAMIHIDAENTNFVYEWRLEQEASLRLKKGDGMTDEQVRRFVDGYYPAYELYTDQLRAGVFGPNSGKQLRLIVGKDRRVKNAIRI
ncbi:hypothetical protein MMC26_003889 [Xylographa opegraphella]|nr:hypothetical protein [Xylographa opegraphella]